VAVLLQGVAEQLGLRLLAALVETFERNQHADDDSVGHRFSGAKSGRRRTRHG
jgi:hypothetical protein